MIHSFIPAIHTRLIDTAVFIEPNLLEFNFEFVRLTHPDTQQNTKFPLSNAQGGMMVGNQILDRSNNF